MGFSWTRKRPTVATIGRARQSKNLAVMVVVMMVMMVVVMVMVGMAGVMRFRGDRRQGNRGGQRQRGDDSI
jgi:heme/copper-type cytochrome/quinol oxidase subunit 2